LSSFSDESQFQDEEETLISRIISVGRGESGYTRKFIDEDKDRVVGRNDEDEKTEWRGGNVVSIKGKL
jgi:hypothetical protein